MGERIGELIGALLRVLFFILVGAFFYARLCGIENALNNLAETQSKIYSQCSHSTKNTMQSRNGCF